MDLGQWLHDGYQKIIVAKKLLCFIFSLCSYLPPFSQIRLIVTQLRHQLQNLENKITQIANSNSHINFLCKVYKQSCIIIIGVIIVWIYIYLKFYYNKQKKNHKKRFNKIKSQKQLDKLSEKTILKSDCKGKKQDKQEVDSCCQQLHNNLNSQITKEDKLFLEILSRYQAIQERQPQTFDLLLPEKQYQFNKGLHDNSSTQQGHMKTSYKDIPNSPKNKREQDLNRSSVL